MQSYLDAEVGDEIYIVDENDKNRIVKITGITENYANHYIYMSSRNCMKIYLRKI